MPAAATTALLRSAVAIGDWMQLQTGAEKATT